LGQFRSRQTVLMVSQIASISVVDFV